MRKCDSCGKLYQESKDVFCPHCGAVAQKQCTHGSSFDSSKYDRGEIYKNNNTPDNTYAQGVEPHIQREKYPYNRFEDTFGDAGKYSDETPRKTLFPDISFGEKSRKSKKNNIKIGAIISGIIILLNFITGMLAINENDYDDVYYEDVSEVYTVENEFYPVSSSASITFMGENVDFKIFELSVEDMYFDYDEGNTVAEIEDSIVNGATFTEIGVCTFSETEVPEDDYDNAVGEGYCISGKESDKEGHYLFLYDFDYGEIVHIYSGVSMYFDNGMYVNTELPFSAFSISEEGVVTYYTSYADDSTDWNTVFTECSNEMTVSDYDLSIVFEDEE